MKRTSDFLARNNIFRRSCGCPMERRFREFVAINIPTAVRAWLHGRSYANYDGYLG